MCGTLNNCKKKSTEPDIGIFPSVLSLDILSTGNCKIALEISTELLSACP